MSAVIAQLKQGRALWPELMPAFDHAIALAREAEYQAQRASNEVQSHIAAAYQPIVVMLADAVGAPEPEGVPF